MAINGLSYRYTSCQNPLEPFQNLRVLSWYNQCLLDHCWSLLLKLKDLKVLLIISSLWILHYLGLDTRVHCCSAGTSFRVKYHSHSGSFLGKSYCRYCTEVLMEIFNISGSDLPSLQVNQSTGWKHWTILAASRNVRLRFVHGSWNRAKYRRVRLSIRPFALEWARSFLSFCVRSSPPSDDDDIHDTFADDINMCKIPGAGIIVAKEYT